MFQTEINHLAQSFASAEFTTFMRLVTSIGYGAFFVFALLMLFLLVDFKRAALVFVVSFCTLVVTYVFKAYFDLPRPFHVDSSLPLLDGQLDDHAVFDFSKRGAPSFWTSLPEEVLEVTRASVDVENGFPSGHTSMAVAFWGALALLFRKRWLTVVATLLIVLIAFSRIYLGVHFLADVIAGLLLGVLILGLFQRFVFTKEWGKSSSS